MKRKHQPGCPCCGEPPEGSIVVGLFMCQMPVEGYTIRAYHGTYALDGTVGKGSFIKDGLTDATGYWDPGFTSGRYYFEADDHEDFWFLPTGAILIGTEPDPIQSLMESHPKAHWACQKCGVDGVASGLIAGGGAEADSMTYTVSGGGYTWNQTAQGLGFAPDVYQPIIECQDVAVGGSSDVFSSCDPLSDPTSGGSTTMRMLYTCDFENLVFNRPNCGDETFFRPLIGEVTCQFNQDPDSGGDWPEDTHEWVVFHADEFEPGDQTTDISKDVWPDPYEVVIRFNFGEDGANWTSPVDFTITEGTPYDPGIRVGVAILTSVPESDIEVIDVDTLDTLISGTSDEFGNFTPDTGVFLPLRSVRYRITATNGCYSGSNEAVSEWQGHTLGGTEIGGEDGSILMGVELEITGTVTDSVSGLPISGATVTFKYFGTTAGPSTTTDGSGNYTLEAFTSADYAVAVSKAGYTTDSTGTQTLGCGPFDHDFVLVPE